MFFQEIKRGLSRTSFKVVLLIGIIANIMSIFITNSGLYSIENYIKAYEISAYDNFIFFNLNSVSNVMILIFPILSAMSYSDSYLEDVNSGFVNYIYTRYSKQKYLICKFGSNFIISGLGIAIPLIINFIILILTVPSIQPNPILGKYTILCGGLASPLFYTHPILYILLWVLIYFMYAGAFASIALGISIAIKNRFVVLFVPFLLCNVIGIVLNLIDKYCYSPLSFLYVSNNQSLNVVIAEFIAIVMISIAIFYLGGNRNENC